MSARGPWRIIAMSWLAIALGAGAVRAADVEWKLVWEDTFDRQEVGPDWRVERGKATVMDGRLLLSGAGSHLISNRGFAPDVRLEFDAEADPAHPPCDLSACLACGDIAGCTFLLAFGGRSNTANQIVGRGVHAADTQPAFVIEHNKVYHIIAQKEGKRLSLSVDGKVVVEATADEAIGGPGFDQIALVTWGGLLADNVRVYERRPPHPDAPVYIAAMPDLGFAWKERQLSYRGELPAALADGVRAYNERKYDEAVAAIRRADDSLLKAAALAYVFGDLAYERNPTEHDELTALARRAAEAASDKQAARDFAEAADWFARLRIFPRDLIAAGRLVALGPNNNPFYYKGLLYKARFRFARAIEGADRPGMAAARDLFASLKPLWPEHPGIRGYTGEKDAWGEDLNADNSPAPKWAAYLHEAYLRQIRILDWWFTVRQMPDGQLGGGWGDDVELLRSWVPVAAISTAPETVIRGIERMAEGLWSGVLRDGYDPGIGDVEHSAEPSADSMPTMILLRYGDPRYIEWNLGAARYIRDVFTAIDQKGYRRFKSSEFGANGINMNARAGGDTGYNARAMKHLIWLGWWGERESHDLFVDWADGWRAATMSTEHGKPAGLTPASIFWPSGDFMPPNGKPWWDSDSHYYGFGGLSGMIHESLLVAYSFTGDAKYLDAIETLLDAGTRGPLPRDPPKDEWSDERWYLEAAHSCSPALISTYRRLTGRRVYDEYTLRLAKPTQRYFVNHDVDAYADTFERLAKGMRYNWAMSTTEVLQTDRAGVPGALETWGAYTGAVHSLRDAATPTMAVTWVTPDPDFAALVTEAARERLRVRLYSFHDAPTRMGMRLWWLEPGRYELKAGRLLPGEHPFQHRYGWGEPVMIDVRHKGQTVWFDLPSGVEWVVDLRQRERLSVPAWRPDLAIAARDVKVTRQGGGVSATVTVHNVGSTDAGPFDVVLEARNTDAWKPLARQSVAAMPGITSLRASTRDVALSASGVEAKAVLRIVLDPDDKIDELVEENNAVTVP